ncbi:aromatase/cyclase [Kitasatospora sp. NPDC051170]|uniref:aromatase/cyclase n=1 Tax=Kitasatospora sp. NPDC051170 TaxID=3364056 RepID=UPI0037A22135
MAPTAATDQTVPTERPETPTRVTEHAVTVSAPAAAVFALVADVAGWPQLFGPTVHAEVVEENVLSDGRSEQLLRIWATANGRARTWTSRRTLDRAAGRITFRQVVSAPPVEAMGGDWVIRQADGSEETHVTLLHDYRAVGDAPEAVALIESAVDHNSRAELAALKAGAEQGPRDDGLCFTFSDSEHIDGSAQDVFDFLNRADLWPERLPHVARLDLTEDEPGIQHMEMDTRSPDGSVHTTVSVRVVFPERRSIVYKQLRVPAAMAGHTGRWEIEPAADGEGVVATSWHTVTLDPEGVRALLGEDATLAQARDLVRKALGTNSSTTLRHARRYAEESSS